MWTAGHGPTPRSAFPRSNRSPAAAGLLSGAGATGLEPAFVTLSRLGLMTRTARRVEGAEATGTPAVLDGATATGSPRPDGDTWTSRAVALQSLEGQAFPFRRWERRRTRERATPPRGVGGLASCSSGGNRGVRRYECAGVGMHAPEARWPRARPPEARWPRAWP